MSSLYETAPVGGPAQDRFLNVVSVDRNTRFRPKICWWRSKRSNFRPVGSAWSDGGRRTLDLDLIVYDELSVDRPDLELPHPRADERRFVLAPLVEVWPDASLRSGPARLALDKVTKQSITLLASEWEEGVPKFLERGGEWVVGQGLVLALWAVALRRHRERFPHAAGCGRVWCRSWPGPG